MTAPGSCATCRARFGITDSPVVEGICAWGHIAPEAWLAPRPGQPPLTTMETAVLLEALGAADDLISDVADKAPSASYVALQRDLDELRADARHLFERTFFEVNR